MRKARTRRSYGVICTRYNIKTKRMEALVIRKRNTFAFIDFALGRYRADDEARLLYLFNHMTSEEKIDISSLDFGRVWYRIWLITRPDVDNALYQKFIISKNHFDASFVHNSGYLYRLLNNSSSISTLWELPKGRQMYRETKYNCAVREFEEETGIKSTDYIVLNERPLAIRHTNSFINYHCEFYIAILQNKRFKPHINYSNKTQIVEIIDIQWMDLQTIRAIDNTRRLYKIVRQAFKILRIKYKIPRLISTDSLNVTN